MLRSFLLFSCSVAALLALEEHANACSPPLHRETVVAPKAGQSLPASAPGILVSGETGIAVQLFDSGGSPVAGTLKTAGYRTYFGPSAPLPVGAYTLRYETWAGGPLEDAAINVTPAVPLPTATGTLTLKETERGMRSVTTSSGSCFEEADASMVRLTFTPDASLVAYGSVVAWETKVDGQYWSQRLGAIEESTGVRTVLNLFTACDTNGTQGRDDGVAPGVHVVTLTPTIVGNATAIAAATLKVTVSCGADNGTVHPTTTEPVTPVTPSDPVKPGGEDIVTAPSSSGSSAESGCAAAPTHGGDFGLLVLASALTVLGMRRRRR